MVLASSWYRKAADQGDTAAQYNLGHSYAVGDGVEQSWVLAASWYRKAAEQGDSDAQHEMGLCYASGKGVPKSSLKAVTYFVQAAMQEQEPALARLRLPTQGWYSQLHVFFPPACHVASWATLLAARRFAVTLPEELWREHIFPCWRQAHFP